MLRGHQHPVTFLAVSPDDKFIFSAAKDGSVIKCKCFCFSCCCGGDLAGAGLLVEVALPDPWMEVAAEHKSWVCSARRRLQGDPVVATQDLKGVCKQGK